jgi:hypothetical protein
MKVTQKDGKTNISLTKKELIKIYYDLESAAVVLDGCEDSDFREDTYNLILLLKKVVRKIQ